MFGCSCARCYRRTPPQDMRRHQCSSLTFLYWRSQLRHWCCRNVSYPRWPLGPAQTLDFSDTLAWPSHHLSSPATHSCSCRVPTMPPQGLPKALQVRPEGLSKYLSFPEDSNNASPWPPQADASQRAHSGPPHKLQTGNNREDQFMNRSNDSEKSSMHQLETKYETPIHESKHRFRTSLHCMLQTPDRFRSLEIK